VSCELNRQIKSQKSPGLNDIYTQDLGDGLMPGLIYKKNSISGGKYRNQYKNKKY
jgi:hypothetical protein